ncbi:MAG: flagellar hook-length control protein FliK [Planctomycetales bacterium]|nr:flagellar hook-length control protein FliK [Planctomycetales bacterium]
MDLIPPILIGASREAAVGGSDSLSDITWTTGDAFPFAGQPDPLATPGTRDFASDLAQALQALGSGGAGGAGESTPPSLAGSAIASTPASDTNDRSLVDGATSASATAGKRDLSPNISGTSEPSPLAGSLQPSHGDSVSPTSPAPLRFVVPPSTETQPAERPISAATPTAITPPTPADEPIAAVSDPFETSAPSVTVDDGVYYCSCQREDWADPLPLYATAPTPNVPPQPSLDPEVETLPASAPPSAVVDANGNAPPLDVVPVGSPDELLESAASARPALPVEPPELEPSDQVDPADLPILPDTISLPSITLPQVAELSPDDVPIDRFATASEGRLPPESAGVPPLEDSTTGPRNRGDTDVRPYTARLAERPPDRETPWHNFDSYVGAFTVDVAASRLSDDSLADESTIETSADELVTAGDDELVPDAGRPTLSALGDVPEPQSDAILERGQPGRDPSVAAEAPPAPLAAQASTPDASAVVTTAPPVGLGVLTQSIDVAAALQPADPSPVARSITGSAPSARSVSLTNDGHLLGEPAPSPGPTAPGAGESAALDDSAGNSEEHQPPHQSELSSQASASAVAATWELPDVVAAGQPAPSGQALSAPPNSRPQVQLQSGAAHVAPAASTPRRAVEPLTLPNLSEEAFSALPSVVHVRSLPPEANTVATTATVEGATVEAASVEGATVAGASVETAAPPVSDSSFTPPFNPTTRQVEARRNIEAAAELSPQIIQWSNPSPSDIAGENSSAPVRGPRPEVSTVVRHVAGAAYEAAQTQTLTVSTMVPEATPDEPGARIFAPTLAPGEFGEWAVEATDRAPDGGAWELRLEPPGMTVRVVLEQHEDRWSASLFTSDAASVAQLDAQLPELRQSLEDAGIVVDTLEVREDSAHGGDQHQPRGGASGRDADTEYLRQHGANRGGGDVPRPVIRRQGEHNIDLLA